LLRLMKVSLVLTVSLWGLVGAILNITDWEGTVGAVGAATSMVTFDGGPESWQATSNPIVIWLGALFITLSKLTVFVLCLMGAVTMWQARELSAASFANAKEFALVGCALAVVMLFGGFIAIAESWFELWRSDAMRGPVLESAFRYGGMIALIGLFVGMKDD